MRSVLWVKNGIQEITNHTGIFRSMLYCRIMGVIHLWAVCWVVLSLWEDSFWISCRGEWCCPKIPVPSPPALLLSLWLRSGSSKTELKNSLLQIHCSKYTRGRALSLKWLLNTHLAGTILKSGSRAGEEMCTGSLKFHSGDGSKQSRLCVLGREITCRGDAG